jgi:hypothetical protein
MTAPVGIMLSLTGDGDWRTLLRTAKSVAWTPRPLVSVGVGGPSALGIEGDRLCRFIYDADECERGSCGRPVTGERGSSSLIDELRLMTGLADLEEAGDCCWAGGV